MSSTAGFNFHRLKHHPNIFFREAFSRESSASELSPSPACTRAKLYDGIYGIPILLQLVNHISCSFRSPDLASE